MSNPESGPVDGVDRFFVSKMLDSQITQTYDHCRMLQLWRRVLAGENDPEEIAQGLCLALSGGRYVPRSKPVSGMTVNLSINLNRDANPDQISAAVVSALHTHVHSR